MMQPLTDAMIEHIQAIELEWYEQSMDPDFFDESTLIEESQEVE